MELSSAPPPRSRPGAARRATICAPLYVLYVLSFWLEVPMPQLHLYVPADVAEALRLRAKAQGVSVSRYLAELAKREVGLSWPDRYERVLGGWQGAGPDRTDTPPLEEPAGLDPRP